MKKAVILLSVIVTCLSLNLSAQNVKQLLKAGDEFMIQGNINDALKQYFKASELQPNNAAVYVKIADAYEKTGNLEKAAENLDRATVFNRKDANVFFRAGQIFYRIENYEKALERSVSALEIKKNILTPSA